MSDETFLDFWSKIPRHQPLEEEQSFLEWVDDGPKLFFLTKDHCKKKPIR